ncbi:Protein NDRG2 [Dirofilaria immitis]
MTRKVKKYLPARMKLRHIPINDVSLDASTCLSTQCHFEQISQQQVVVINTALLVICPSIFNQFHRFAASDGISSAMK